MSGLRTYERAETERLRRRAAELDKENADLRAELTQTKYQEQAYHNEANELRAEVERLTMALSKKGE